MNAKRNTQTIIKAVCYKTLPITILTCIWCCSASAQELQLAPNTDPDAPYIYKEHRYTKDLIQLKLFTLIQDPEEFLKVFDFF